MAKIRDKKTGELFNAEQNEKGEWVVTGPAYEGPKGLQKLGGELTDDPTPPQEETFAGNFKQGLTSNRPTRGVGGYLGRNALPMAGGALGGLGGTVGGFGVGSIPGAGIGAAAGESVRQSLVGLLGNPLEMSPMEIGKSGAVGAASQAGGELIAKGAGAAYRSVAPQLTSFATKVPLKFTQAAVKGDLKGAKSLAEAGQQYDKAVTPLKSLDKSLKAATGKRLSVNTSDFKAIAEDAAQALDDGTITPQKALWGRQAIQKIEQEAKLGRDEFAGVKGEYIEVKKALDAYLEKSFPDLKAARGDYFKAKGADAFNSWLPRNKTGDPDTLRFLMGATVQPVALPMMSPRIAKGAIDATNAAGPVLEKLLGPALQGLRGVPNALQGETMPPLRPVPVR